MISRYIHGALLLALVVAGFVIAISLSENADATITGDAPPATGDWVVNSATVVTGETVYVDGNLTVNGDLVIMDSTVTMNVTAPWQYNIGVSPGGRVTATDTTFSSNDTVAGYGFRVWGQVDLLRCRITGSEDGLRVLTDRAQSIASTTIDDFHLGGLYLEDADGTSVMDVFIQSDRYEVAVDLSRKIKEQEEDYPQLYFTYILETAPIHIRGGDPSIQGVRISVNGTVSASGTLDYYSSKYIQLRTYYYTPLVLVESESLRDMVDVSIFDSVMDFPIDYRLNIHTSIGTSSHYVYDYFHMCPMVFRNPDVLDFEDISIKDVRLGATTVQYQVVGGNAYFYQYSEGTLGIMVHDNETYEGTEVYTLDIELSDSYFLRSGALHIDLAGRGTDEERTRFALNLAIDSITIVESSSKGCLVVDNAIGYENELDFWVEVAITDSLFTGNGGDVINLGLSGGGTGNAASITNVGTGSFHGTMNIYDNITIEDCRFEENWGRCINIVTGGASGIGSASGITDEAKAGGSFNGNVYEWIYIRNNVFDDHKGTSYGPIGTVGVSGAHNGTEVMVIERNTFTNADPGTSMPALITIDGKDVIEFTNNTLSENAGGNAMRITSNGGDGERAQPASILISDNDFLGNRFQYSSEAMYGTINVVWGGDVEITRNKVSDDSSTAFFNIRDITQYAGFSNLHFHHNQFVDSPDMGGVIYVYSCDAYNNLLTATVEENLVRDCGAALVMNFYDQTALDLHDYDATIVFKNNTVSNALGEVIKAYGNIRIEDNTFTNCRGYVLNLQYLSRYIPVLEGNTFQGCHDLVYMGGKAKNLGGLLITLENLEVDCTGNAFRFNNMQATCYNFKISDNANPAVIAENSVVSIVAGSIEVGSGRIIGPGSITRYRLFEAIATWADATGADTGVPASDVPVLLLDSQGRLTVSRSTDEAGGMGPLRVAAWSMRSMFLTQLTPHKLLIGTPGIASSMIVVFDRDYVGEGALSIQVVDDQLPVVRVTSPIEGQYSRSTLLTVKGFVLEQGSGVREVTLSIEGRDPAVVSLDASGRFAHVVEDLLEGDVHITLTVEDIAGNSNNAVVSITLDRTPPAINIMEPGSDLTTNSTSVHLVLALEAGCDLFINGLEQQYTDGQASLAWPLSEGENFLLVEAIDAAGNVATESITVTRDTIPPHLIVLSPRDGSLTNDGTPYVMGDTEPGVVAWLVVLFEGEEVQNLTLTPDEEGAFSLSIQLDEGTSMVGVCTRDAADNFAEVWSLVTVDITPPDVAITSPGDGWLSNSGTVHVLGTADDDCLLYLNGMPLGSGDTIDRTLILDEGTTIIELLAMDPAGNAGVSRISVTMDTTKPLIDLVKPIFDRVRTTDPVIEIEGRILGEFQTLTVMGEEVTVLDGSFSKTVTLTSEGLNEIRVRATDVAGNSDEKVIFVDVSWTEPQLAVELMTDGGPGKSTNGTILIVGAATGNVSRLLVFHNGPSGDEVLTYLLGESGDFKIASNLEEGMNTIILRAVDSYGNYEETDPYTIDYRPHKETAEEEGAIELLDVGIIILGFGLALLVMVFIAGWLRNRYRP